MSADKSFERTRARYYVKCLLERFIDMPGDDELNYQLEQVKCLPLKHPGCELVRAELRAALALWNERCGKPKPTIDLGPFARPWKYESRGEMVYMPDETRGMIQVADMRGWGYLTGGGGLGLSDDAAIKIQDAVGQSIVDAHNAALPASAKGPAVSGP